MNFKIIFLSRYMSWIAVISSILGAFLMFIAGSIRVINAYSLYFSRVQIGVSPSTSSSTNYVVITMTILVGGIDIFLFALALLIFGYGIYYLFLADHEEMEKFNLPEWARVSSVTELKSSLAQVIIIILFVEFLESVFESGLDYVPWEALVIPIAALLLAGALKLMHERKVSDPGEKEHR